MDLSILKKYIIFSILLFCSSVVMAGDALNVPSGETRDIAPTESHFGGGDIYGTLNNYGEIRVQHSPDTTSPPDFFVDGDLHNYGNMLIDGALSISGGDNPDYNYTITNHVGGNIILYGYIDMYSNRSIFINAGKLLSLGPKFGHSAQINGEITYFISDHGFTAGLLRGQFTNTSTGILVIDHPNDRTSESCRGGNGFYMTNYGYLEITDGTKCNFAKQSSNPSVEDHYFIQVSGTLKVDGELGADQFILNSGIIYGDGKITAKNNPISFGSHITISPGDGIGVLTVHALENQVNCNRCSLDMELAGSAQSDQLAIDGNFNIHNGAVFTIVLRNGYVPTPGTQFTLIVADSISITGSQSKYNLPELPDGRDWGVDNHGSSLVLTAN